MEVIIAAEATLGMVEEEAKAKAVEVGVRVEEMTTKRTEEMNHQEQAEEFTEEIKEWI